MSTTVYSQVLIYTVESTGASMERKKMPNLRNGSKGGFEAGLTRLFVRRSPTELPRCKRRPLCYICHTYSLVCLSSLVTSNVYVELGGCPSHGRVERDEIPTRESPPKQSGTLPCPALPSPSLPSPQLPSLPLHSLPSASSQCTPCVRLAS